MTDFNFAAELEEFFKDTAYGTPDNITHDGCIALALLDNQLCVKNNIENGTLWNYWRHKYPVTENGNNYYNYSNFKNYEAEKHGYINFSHFDFDEYVDFSGATFTERAIFKDIIFKSLADFRRATFTELADFRGVTFTERADFRGVTFNERADFRGETFTELVNFSGAKFKKQANFSGAFTEMVDFSGAKFTEMANFRNVTFTEWADFSGAIFKTSLYLDNCTFKKLPPLLFDATLCENFTVLNCNFKAIPANDTAKRAYGKIKEHYAKIKNTQGELEFAVYELEQERLLEKRQPDRIFFYLYKLTANYGQSILRPLCYYLLSFVLLKAIILTHDADLIHFDTAINWYTVLDVCKIILDGFMPSVTSKPLELGSIALSCQAESWLNVLHSIQKISSIVGWFLIALAMKNLFKIRSGG